MDGAMFYFTLVTVEMVTVWNTGLTPVAHSFRQYSKHIQNCIQLQQNVLQKET